MSINIVPMEGYSRAAACRRTLALPIPRVAVGNRFSHPPARPLGKRRACSKVSFLFHSAAKTGRQKFTDDRHSRPKPWRVRPRGDCQPSLLCLAHFASRKPNGRRVADWIIRARQAGLQISPNSSRLQGPHFQNASRASPSRPPPQSIRFHKFKFTNSSS